MAITFTKRLADGAVIADFSGSPHEGNLDTFPISGIPGLKENDVIRFAHAKEASKSTVLSVLVVLEDGSYAVANGMAAYTVMSVGPTEYTVRRGNT